MIAATYCGFNAGDAWPDDKSILWAIGACALLLVALEAFVISDTPTPVHQPVPEWLREDFVTRTATDRDRMRLGEIVRYFRPDVEGAGSGVMSGDYDNTPPMRHLIAQRTDGYEMGLEAAARAAQDARQSPSGAQVMSDAVLRPKGA